MLATSDKLCQGSKTPRSAYSSFAGLREEVLSLCSGRLSQPILQQLVRLLERHTKLCVEAVAGEQQASTAEDDNQGGGGEGAAANKSSFATGGATTDRSCCRNGATSRALTARRDNIAHEPGGSGTTTGTGSGTSTGSVPVPVVVVPVPVRSSHLSTRRHFRASQPGSRSTVAHSWAPAAAEPAGHGRPADPANHSRREMRRPRRFSP